MSHRNNAQSPLKHLGAYGLLLILSACATPNVIEDFQDVTADVEARTGQKLVWQIDENVSHDTENIVNQLLSRPLTPNRAIKVALLKSPTLQAHYADLGIARAGVVQAGLVKNPVFDGSVSWFADAGGTPNLAFGVVWSFVDLIHRPLRLAVAESELQEVKVRVAGKVIAHTAKTYEAYINYVAARQEETLASETLRSAKASATVAQTLRKAGNISNLEVEQQKSLVARLQLETDQVKSRVKAAREKLASTIGLGASDRPWTVPNKLPPVPANPLTTRQAEARALHNSLDIEEARLKLLTLGKTYRLIKRTALLPDLEAGPEYEREIEVEEGKKTARKAVGAVFEAEIPLFDHGQARKAGAYFRIEKAENELKAVIANVKSAARLAASDLKDKRRTARYVRTNLVPQATRTLTETQRGYNAMQQSIFQLVSAKRQQIRSRRQELSALRAYWLARVRFQTLMNGRLPDAGMKDALSGTGLPEVAGNQGGH